VNKILSPRQASLFWPFVLKTIAMTTTRLLFSLIFVAFACISVWAQPDMNSFDYNGCGFYHLKLNPDDLGTDRENCGSNARSDSIDILNYNVTIDTRDFGGKTITASCEITFTAKQNGLGFLPLDLLALTVDSVMQNGVALVFDYDNLLLNVHLPSPLNVGEISEIIV
jgi:hypothetical protein